MGVRTLVVGIGVLTRIVNFQVDTFYSRFIAWWSKHNPPKARVNCPIPYPFHIIGLLVHVLTPQLEGAPNLSYWILVALAALTLSVALLYM